MEQILNKLKLIVSVVGAAVTAVLGTYPPDDSQFYKILTGVAAVLTMIGVYLVPNKPVASKAAANQDYVSSEGEPADNVGDDEVEPSSDDEAEEVPGGDDLADESSEDVVPDVAPATQTAPVVDALNAPAPEPAPASEGPQHLAGS
jgi:hypothetical protein